MKSLVFDTGPVISLSMNSLLWILYPLKKKFGGKFYITKEVQKELIETPLKIKRYMFEALKVQDMLNENIFELIDNKEIQKKSKELMELANSCFYIGRNNIKIVQIAEMQSLASAIILKSDAMVIDERTTRMLIEQPELLENLLEQKLNADVKINTENLGRFRQEVKDVKIIRSVELAIVAYKLGFLNRYVTANKKTNAKMKSILLYSVLWALKLNGCAISGNEIDEIVSMEK